MSRLFVKTLDWADVRSFIKANPSSLPWIEHQEEVKKIMACQTANINGQFLREISVWIDGYLSSKTANAQPPNANGDQS